MASAASLVLRSQAPTPIFQTVIPGDQKVFDMLQNSPLLINQIRKYRFTGDSSEITETLRAHLGELPPIADDIVQNAPLLAMFALILNADVHQDHLRQEAARKYHESYPQDTEFESSYADLKEPVILLAHLLLQSGSWSEPHPERGGYYEDQMMGLFLGTISFGKGDSLSVEEMEIIQVTYFPFIDNFDDVDGVYVPKQ